MSAKLYISRALKYLLKLLLLVAVLYLLLFATQTARVSAMEALRELFTTWRGYGMIGALAALAFAYPSYGFVTRRIGTPMPASRDELLDVFHRGGYSLYHEEDGEMVFKAFSLAKRIWLVGDDRIVVRSDGDGFTISGIRKDVVQAEFRMNTYLRNSEGDTAEK